MNVYKCRQWDNPISEFSYTVFLQAHIYSIFCLTHFLQTMLNMCIYKKHAAS